MHLCVLKTLWGKEGKKPWERGLWTSPPKSCDIEVLSRGSELEVKCITNPRTFFQRQIRKSFDLTRVKRILPTTWTPRSLIPSPDVYSELRKREANTCRRWLSMKPTDLLGESSSFDSNSISGISIDAIKSILYMCTEYKNMSSDDLKKDINSGELLSLLLFD